MIHSAAPPLDSHIVPLELKSLHLLMILVHLQPSLACRFLDLKSVRLVRGHANFMAAKGMLDRADTLCLKVRVVKKGCHPRKGHNALAEEVKYEVVLHVNVPGTAPARVVLNDGLNAIVVSEDLDRKGRLVIKFLKKINQPLSLSSSIRGSTVLSFCSRARNQTRLSRLPTHSRSPHSKHKGSLGSPIINVISP